MKRLLSVFILIVSLGIFAGLSVSSAWHESLTYDEPVHIEEGLRAWRERLFTIDVVNPPLVREIAVLPLVVGGYLHSSLPSRSIFLARCMVIGMTAFMIAGVFFVTRRYFGFVAACLALVFLIFEPDIQAHGHYVTIDAGFTTFFFLAYIILVRFVEKPTVTHAIAFGLSAGWAMAAKASGLPFLALSAVALGVMQYRTRIIAILIRRIRLIAIACAISLTAVWATYFFQWDTVIAKSDREGRVSGIIYERARQSGNGPLMKTIEVLENVPIPFGGYIRMMKNSAIYAYQQRQQSESYGIFAYVAPSLRPLVLLGLKMPLPLLVAWGMSMVWGISAKKHRRAVFFFALPVFVIIGSFILQPVNSWMRYLLPVIPFLAISASLWAAQMVQAGGINRIVVVCLFVWYIVGSLVQYPHMISYANEFAGRRDRRYTKLMENTIDWGQALITFHQYIQRKQPRELLFSYFGRDDAAQYGFPSTVPYGSYKFNEICAFHPVSYPTYKQEPLVAISVTNWYECGYHKEPKYSERYIVDIIADSILIFTDEGFYARK